MHGIAWHVRRRTDDPLNPWIEGPLWVCDLKVDSAAVRELDKILNFFLLLYAYTRPFQ
jgi:hypothetical protein